MRLYLVSQYWMCWCTNVRMLGRIYHDLKQRFNVELNADCSSDFWIFLPRWHRVLWYYWRFFEMHILFWFSWFWCSKFAMWQLWAYHLKEALLYSALTLSGFIFQSSPGLIWLHWELWCFCCHGKCFNHLLVFDFLKFSVSTSMVHRVKKGFDTWLEKIGVWDSSNCNYVKIYSLSKLKKPCAASFRLLFLTLGRIRYQPACGQRCLWRHLF